MEEPLTIPTLKSAEGFLRKTNATTLTQAQAPW